MKIHNKEKPINIFASRLIKAVHAKTAGLHMVLRGNFSGPISATDPVKSSIDSSSLVVCTQKKIFGWGCGFFLSDVISGRLLGHLGPLRLALGPNHQMVVFRWSFYWKLGYNPGLLILWMTCWRFGFKSEVVWHTPNISQKLAKSEKLACSAKTRKKTHWVPYTWGSTISQHLFFKALGRYNFWGKCSSSWCTSSCLLVYGNDCPSLPMFWCPSSTPCH